MTEIRELRLDAPKSFHLMVYHIVIRFEMCYDCFRPVSKQGGIAMKETFIQQSGILSDLREVNIADCDGMYSATFINRVVGKNKAKAVYGLVKGEVTTEVPASILQKHPDCTLICDEEAAALIK